jgi:hypothetical protein
MTVQDERAGGRPQTPAPEGGEAEQLQRVWNRVVGRRAFLRQAGLAGAIALPGAAVAASSASADIRRGRDEHHGRPTEGDFAILRFLCAAEIIESDLWEQYAAFGGQATSERPDDGRNPAYIAALENLDGDMPQYISDNTDDEESHQQFINAYLVSKGQDPVDLDPFRTLPPSPATGGPTKPTLTNLMALNVDTSWYLRYRATTNPDFGATFGQAVTIRNQAVIPISDAQTPPHNDAPVPVPPDAAHQRMQAIANSAGFHFAMIEWAGRACTRRWRSRPPASRCCASWWRSAASRPTTSGCCTTRPATPRPSRWPGCAIRSPERSSPTSTPPGARPHRRT